VLVEQGGPAYLPLHSFSEEGEPLRLVERVCAAFDCPHYEHLSIAENFA